MSETKYNGWSNYETWDVALWIDNEESSYRYWRARTHEACAVAEITPGTLTQSELAVHLLADWLRSEIEEAAPHLGASMFGDLLGRALSTVNWHEIAEHWIAEIADEDQGVSASGSTRPGESGVGG